MIAQVMESYKPSAVVLQSGTDSLQGDKLGCFNLSMRGDSSAHLHMAALIKMRSNCGTGHANCVRFVKSFGLPTLLLGGGGYTMRNVSRAWAYETGIAAGYELGAGTCLFPIIQCPTLPGIPFGNADLPVNEYYDYFGPDYKLDVRSSNMEDRNSIEYLERIKNVVMEHLREIGGPPSVQMSGACCHRYF